MGNDQSCCRQEAETEKETVKVQAVITEEEDDDVGSFEEPPASAALHGHGEKEPGGPAEAGKVRHEMSLEGNRRSSSALSLSLDPEILRSVRLRSTLKGGGRLWRKSPIDMHKEQRLQLWEQSEPTEEIDVFFSHTWQTAGHWKYLALLFETGSSFSLAAWGVVSATMTLLCCLGAVPLPFGPTTRVLKFEAVTPMGPWIILSGMVASLLGLIASPHAPGLLRRDESCFLDKVCIHQEDPDLMRRGVYGLGVYLRMSKQLRVLWSSPYFTRLWCIFEIAAYAALNSSGRVVLAPVFMGWMQVLLLLCSYYLSVVMWLATIAESLNLSAYLIAISPLCFVTHALRRSFHLRQLVVVELENFDLNAADCRVAADRDFVHEAIIAWYGSTNAFTQYVRGDLRMELLKSIRTNVPRIYVALLATAPLSASLEGFVGLCRAGAPWRSLLSYVVGHTLGIHLFWWYLSIRFLFYLCNLHWWTCSGRWAFVDYLQTLLVFLAFSVFYCLGGMIGYLSYSTNLGAATAFASVALFLNLNSVQSFSGFLHSCLPRRISSRLSTVLPPPPRPLNSVSS